MPRATGTTESSAWAGWVSTVQYLAGRWMCTITLCGFCAACGDGAAAGSWGWQGRCNRQLSYIIPCWGLWGSDEGNDMKYQRIYFYSSSVQHKGLLPAGLGLKPQDAGWWFQPVVPNPCNYGSKWGSWLCSQALTVLLPFGHERVNTGFLHSAWADRFWSILSGGGRDEVGQVKQ